MIKQGHYFDLYKRKNTRDGYLFLLPAMIAFVIFIGVPIIMAIGLSFTKYNLLQPPEFTGFANLKRLMADRMAWQSLKNTAKYFVIITPVQCVLGLFLAFIVTQVRLPRMRSFFRSVIYFPTIITTASVAIVWSYMFATDSGFINYFLRQMGLTEVPWMTNPTMAYVTIAMFSFWKFIGITFLYYFVGLQNIPDTYYEAAEIDGAGRIRTFFKVSLPLLSPTIFFVIVTNMIGVFQIFDEPFFLSNTTNTKSLSVYIYETAFVNMKVGYGSVLAIFMFIIILTITIIQFVGQRKWVTYDYE